MEKPLTTRKRQALEMRSRIQYVALDLFDRDGFENVSVEQIAQAAGCSVGNIYHYFKSKDELIIHITSSVDAQYEVLEREYLSDTTVSARSKLLDFVGRALDISSKDPSLYRSFIHGLKYPEQAILRDNETRVYFRVLRELTAACQQEGSISPQRDGQELVAELVALHRGMLFEWRSSPSSSVKPALPSAKSSAPSSPAKPPSSAASSSSASVWKSSFPASWAEKNSSAPAHLCRGAFLFPMEHHSK